MPRSLNATQNKNPSDPNNVAGWRMISLAAKVSVNCSWFVSAKPREMRSPLDWRCRNDSGSRCSLAKKSSRSRSSTVTPANCTR